jgi:hypothetical protein
MFADRLRDGELQNPSLANYCRVESNELRNDLSDVREFAFASPRNTLASGELHAVSFDFRRSDSRVVGMRCGALSQTHGILKLL